MRDKPPEVDYSNIAEYYDDARPGPADIWISTIARLGRISAGSRVLDVGCGTGRFTLKTAERCGCPTYGIDSSPQMLGKALQKDASQRIGWLAGDAHRLPLQSSSFDCAYMTMVIHHIKSKKAALVEMHRVLRPGGRCVILTSSHSTIRNHVLRHFPGVIPIDVKRFPSIPSLRLTMKRAGFVDVVSTLVKYNESERPVENYLDMVRRKYISTLSLLDERKFDAGFRVFEERIRNIYGNSMRRVLAFNFVVGEKHRSAHTMDVSQDVAEETK